MNELKTLVTSCIRCGLPMNGEETIDYEYWPTHEACLGPYDAWIDMEETGETIYKRGYETADRADEVIRNDYPDAKHWLIRKVR